MARFPWNIVRSFKVESCANGTIRITPDYDPAKIRPWTPEDGGGPGLFTRMRLALWIEQRLVKRGSHPLADGGEP